MSLSPEQVEAALPMSEYYWYRLKAPITLSLRGKEVKLERGERVGIRPSQSNPAKFLIVTDSLPLTKVFTVDIKAFKELGKYMAGIGKERLKRMAKKPTPVSTMTAEFDVQGFVDSFESIQALIEHIDTSLYAGLLNPSAVHMQKSQRGAILQFRKMFQLTSNPKQVALYRMTRIKQPIIKDPQPGMVVMFKPLLTFKGGFHTWYLTSERAELNDDVSAPFLLETQVPTNLIVWCPAVCVAVKQATSSLVSAAKKKWGIPGPEDEKNYLYDRLRTVWKDLIYLGVDVIKEKEVLLDALAIKGGLKCQILKYDGDEE